MKESTAELKRLIDYHQRNLTHIELIASKEEVKEYREDMLSRAERTRKLLAEWSEELRRRGVTY